MIFKDSTKINIKEKEEKPLEKTSQGDGMSAIASSRSTNRRFCSLGRKRGLDRPIIHGYKKDFFPF